VNLDEQNFPKPIFRLEKAKFRPATSEPLLRGTSTKLPGFVVRRESRATRWWESLKTLGARVNLADRSALSYNPLRNSTLARSHLGSRPLSGSFLLHCLAILSLIYLPREFPDTSVLDTPPATPEVIYYQAPIPSEPQPAPHIAPQGPGGRPMSGAEPAKNPALGSTAARKMVVIVSKPSQPDNTRQTIVQPKSPDVKITTDLQLPNMIIGNASALHAPLQFNPNDSKPVETRREVAPAAAPSPETTAQVTALLSPPNFQPKMPVPVAATPAQKATGSTSAALEAPQITGNPALGVTGIVALSVDPGTNLAPPPGNRSGEFAISQNVDAGSPGGRQSAAKSGGAGSTGQGGDTSIGVGVNVTGGAGAPGWNLAVSVNGTGKESSPGALSANLASSMVYPVPSSFVLRKNELIVSTGPVGGGGLDVYGALNCGKIYTIFLSMPVKSWTMQYCLQAAAGSQATTDTYATVVHLGQGLVPPQAETKFDFKRLPVAPALLHKLIILRGTLGVDGTVDEIQIYQGIQPDMDEAARLALRRWKFKPALREGKAVPVQVLVGIPVDGAGSHPPGE
jgi:Gram-negative bacterial TonB protein C-terminal